MSALLALLSIHAAVPSASEVLDDLDAHPWLPSPSASAKPAPQNTVSKAASASTQKETWQIQLGALSTEESAAAERKRVEKILGPGSVETVEDKGVRKLRYGNFASKEVADSARTALKAKGVEGFSVRKP